MPPLIEGVVLRPLRLLPDGRGFVMELLRADWSEFAGFAQAYVTACYPGVVKAWHCHQHQWDHFACVHGMARVALYDDRPDSPTRGAVAEYHLGLLRPALLKIPPRVFHGFTAEGTEPALVVNFPTQLYRYGAPDELRRPHDDPAIPYSWATPHG